MGFSSVKASTRLMDASRYATQKNKPANRSTFAPSKVTPDNYKVNTPIRNIINDLDLSVDY